MSTDWPPPGHAHSYDPESRELLGPVKMCIEERPGVVCIREYGPDRELIAFSFEHKGKKTVHSSSDHSETYDAQGHLLSNRSPNGDGTFGETFYEYDEAGRRHAITNNQNSDRTEYLYEANRLRMSTHTFDPKTIEGTRNSAFAGSAWDAAEHGFGVPMGGSTITSYDERQNPIERQVLTADGRIVSQFIRKHDAYGRLEEEKQLKQNFGLQILERMTPEQRGSLTPEQVQGIEEKMNKIRGKLPPEARYKYDAQGRVIEKRERNVLHEKTTTIEYNDRGDIVRKRQTFTDNSVNIQGNRPPQDSDARYSYQYDSFNNWTEKVVTVDCGADRATQSTTSTTRRTITYY